MGGIKIEIRLADDLRLRQTHLAAKHAVDGDEAKLLVFQKNVLLQVFDECTILRLAGAHGLLGAFSFGDVPGDAHNAVDATFFVDNGNFGGGQPAFGGIDTGLPFHFVDQGDSGLQNPAFVCMEFLGQLGGIEIEIGAADGFLSMIYSQVGHLGMVDPRIARLLVLEIDQMGHALHQDVEQVALPSEFLFGQFAVGDVPRENHDANFAAGALVGFADTFEPAPLAVFVTKAINRGRGVRLAEIGQDGGKVVGMDEVEYLAAQEFSGLIP